MRRATQQCREYFEVAQQSCRRKDARSSGVNFPDSALALPGSYPGPNFLAYHQLEELGGYHPNSLRSYRELVAKAGLNNFDVTRLMTLLNARYLVSAKPLPSSELKEVNSPNGRYIYENPSALPRAFVVYNHEQITDREAILDRLLDPAFDYESSVILENQPAVEESGHENCRTRNRAEIYDDRINSFRVRVRSECPGVLVVLDNYYPAWKAFLDGKETTILRANYTFRAVVVPEGEHTIEFEYTSEVFRLGLLSTLVSFCFIVASIVFLTRIIHK